MKITSGGLTENQAHNLERHLINAGIFTGPWQIESSLVVNSAPAKQQLLKAESVSKNSAQGRDATNAISGQKMTTAMSIIADRNANMSAVANVPVTAVVASQEASVPVKTETNTQAKPYAPAVKANHLDQLKIGGDLEKKMFQIRKSIREMERAYSSRGHLSDPIIHSYAEVMAAKMRGEIKSSVIRPVLSQVASIGFASLEQTLIEYLTPELLHEAEIEVRSGVAAGDEVEDVSNTEEKEILDKKIEDYNAQIKDKLVAYSKKPDLKTTEDTEVYREITQKIADKYYNGNIQNAARDANVAFNLYKLYEKDPSKKPEILLSFAPAIPMVPVALGEMALMAGAAGAAIAGVAAWLNGDSREITKLTLDEEGQADYNKAYTERHGNRGYASASQINDNARSVAAVGSSTEDQESGICKVALPYSPDDEAFKAKEPWMLPIDLSSEDISRMHGIKLYGLNPKILNKSNKKEVTFVNTELLGGDAAARECFKNLTGRYPVPIQGKANFIKPDGTFVLYREVDASKSGHPKVEINGKNTNKVHEKITFK